MFYWSYLLVFYRRYEDFILLLAVNKGILFISTELNLIDRINYYEVYNSKKSSEASQKIFDLCIILFINYVN